MADLNFKIIEHPADVGVIAYGKDDREIFQNAAMAMLSIIADPSNVSSKESFRVELKAKNKEELLISWLNELIYLVDSKKVLLAKFKIEELTDNKLKAKVSGERIDPKKHKLFMEIKAATYNQFELAKDHAKVIFDI